MIKVILKGDVVKEFENGITIAEVAKSIGAGLYKAACVAKVDGKLKDLRTTLNNDCKLEILTFDDPDGKKAFWHTTSHVMAEAVLHVFPNAKFAIGPAIDNGFYYDFDVETPFTTEDLEKIEKEMATIIKRGSELSSFVLDADEALDVMKDQPYKIELINEHAGNGEKISFYEQEDFKELCAGPHLINVSPIKAVKLTACTGAYWRGNEKNKMLSRIYGISFPKKSALTAYLERMEEAKKRDHRKLGKDLKLFTLMEEGPGFPFFLPKGMIIKNKLIEYWRELHTRWGYVEISTPMMLNRQLWERSGHWFHYKENMYTTVIDDTDFAIKPMNCPGGMLVYKQEMHSYRDLPLRVGELGLVHRHEMSGALHGLMRVRCFTQDDAHIFMTEEQIKDEIMGVVKLIDEVYSLFGFKYHIELSTMPEDHMGEVAIWDNATKSLKAAMDELGRDYVVNEGDGAFYGPKLDFHLEDSIGRTWQCGTIQLDFQLPERFELEYTGADGEKHRPVMIHRVAFGSIERFIGILIEHFAGAFPTWLSPVQAEIIPVSDKFAEYAKSIEKALLAKGIRVHTDKRPEKMGYKIREAQMQKTPYMLIVGQKEQEANTISLRSRKNGDCGSMSLEKFIDDITKEIETKAL